MDELHLVVDMESDNFCDKCGENIKAGNQYYAATDDKLLLCESCFYDEED